MRVIWSPRAIDRVTEIAGQIASDRPEAARGWVADLFDRVRSLVAHPEHGRRLPELVHTDYREILFGNYRVIYVVGARQVRIVTVRHARRQFEADELESPE